MKTLFFYENTVFMGNSICETYKHKNLWHETQRKALLQQVIWSSDIARKTTVKICDVNLTISSDIDIFIMHINHIIWCPFLMCIYSFI